MRSSIFRKQFLLYMGILSLSFLLLIGVLSRGLTEYFTNTKKQALVEQAEKLVPLCAKGYLLGRLGYFDLMQIMSELEILQKYLDANFLFVNNDFQIIGYGGTPDVQGIQLDIPELAGVMEGEIISATVRMDGVFSEQVLTVAYPIVLSNGDVAGAVLMNSFMSEIQKTIADAKQMVFWCMLISAAAAFILIYISSRTTTRPLLQMNEAAKVIANGDFEKRISVKTKDEVGQLADSFNEMAKGLSDQEKLRKEFISNISHDFRSPLTSMRGFLEAMLDGTIPKENYEKYLCIVLEETNRLSKLANDILDINSVQVMDMELCRTNFDINEMIRKTVISYESRILEKGLDMQIVLADEVNEVNGDQEKIQRVIHNLLDNAVKFTPQNGMVKIETTLKENYVYISVADTGCGIALKDQKRIFERFYKVDPSRGVDPSGSGLGLSIVREMIKAHGESIVVESSEDKGTKFIFRLPRVERD